MIKWLFSINFLTNKLHVSKHIIHSLIRFRQSSSIYSPYRSSTWSWENVFVLGCWVVPYYYTRLYNIITWNYQEGIKITENLKHMDLPTLRHMKFNATQQSSLDSEI